MTVYFAEQQAISAIEFTKLACTPETSVVVEACAGSGKTWLLVARIVGLLLNGVAPHNILAITFTRKAAAEMHNRLLELLQYLASQSVAEVIDTLVQRGLSQAEAEAMLPQARQLYTQVLASPYPITIDTFHGWFMRLLRGAPLSSGLPPGMTLYDKVNHLRNQVWQQFWKNLGKPKAQHYRQAYEQLLDELGEFQTQAVLEALFSQRANWWALSTQADAMQLLEQTLGTGQAESWSELAAKKMTCIFEQLVQIAQALGQGSAAEAKRAQTWIQCYESSCCDNPAEGTHLSLTASAVATAFNQLWTLFFTDKGTARVLKPTKVLSAALGADRITSVLEQYEQICTQLLETAVFLEEEKALRVNRALFTLGEALIQCYQDSKTDQCLIDFVDLEWQAARLLQDVDTATYLQMRLDARYRHILLDEFQDTNPLQWHILLGWLDSYSQTDEAPRIFLVGDPKQSIYRFRGADARLFNRARIYLHTHFQALVLRTACTRRNAQAVLDWTNAVFSLAAASGAMPDYVRQDSAVDTQISSAAFVLPLIPRTVGTTEQPTITSEVEFQWRDSLAPVLDHAAESLYLEEGQQAAKWIRYCLTSMPRDAARDAEPLTRWSDFLLLARRKEHFIEYERALRMAGIPCVSLRQGGLLETLEILDLSALLQFLMTPADNLSLAHVLKSPIFNISDADLLLLRNYILQSRSESVAQTIHAHFNDWWAGLGNYRQQQNCPANLVEAYQQLSCWLSAAAHLAVHDLLDLIYASGELKKRYIQAAPVELQQQISANLDRFLYLALEMEGGRYPSLPKFIDYLQEMRKGVLAESPDEGQITPFSEDPDAASLHPEINAVRIMTIHAAKGLEAPYVLLLDANTPTRQPSGPDILLHWPPDQPTPQHLSAWGKGWRGRRRENFFNEEQKILDREDWNLLYVAMTRAQQVLAISGVAHIRGDAQGLVANSWYARLAQVDIAQTWSAESVSAPVQDATVVHRPFVERALKVNYQDFQPECDTRITQARSMPLLQQEDVNSIAAASQNLAITHGKHVHDLLERLTRQGLMPIPSDQALAVWFNISIAESRAVAQTVRQIIEAPACQRFFLPENYLRAWNEVELFSAEGHLLRIDRLVEFADEWMILDFKTGMKLTDHLVVSQAHQMQLQAYAVALAQIAHNKPIRAGLITAAGQLLDVAIPD